MFEILAMLTMTIDHIGVLFFPNQEMWRIIGRIAFPLYAYFITIGYVHTKNMKKYSFRLLTLALFCHIPHLIGIDFGIYNVIFTLFLGLIALLVIDKKINMLLKIFILLFIGITAISFPFDYGIYGVLTIVMYRYCKGYLLLLVHILLNALFIHVFEDFVNIQWFSLTATCILLFSKKVKFPNIKVNRTLYRLYYPGHQLILYSIFVMF